MPVLSAIPRLAAKGRAYMQEDTHTNSIVFILPNITRMVFVLLFMQNIVSVSSLLTRFFLYGCWMTLHNDAVMLPKILLSYFPMLPHSPVHIHTLIVVADIQVASCSLGIQSLAPGHLYTVSGGTC